MRKPINNETQLINEIWNKGNQELNERRQVAGPSIYEPIEAPHEVETSRRALGIGIAAMADQPHGQDDLGAMQRAEAEKYSKLPQPDLAKRLGWDWKDIKKKASEKKQEVPTAGEVIDFGDYEEGDVATVAIELPKPKITPATGQDPFEAPHGQDDLGAMERAEAEKPKPRDARFTPAFPDAGLKLTKPVTFDPNIFTEPKTGKKWFVSDAAKEAGILPMPTLPEQPMDAAVGEFNIELGKKFADSVFGSFKPKSKAEFSPVSTEEQPMDAAAKEYRKTQKLPEQPMDTAVKQQRQAQDLGWKSGSEQQTAVDKLQTKLDQAIEGIKGVQKTTEDAAKIREATKKFVASQPPEIQAAMEREDKAKAAEKRMLDRLAGKPETSSTTMQAPSIVKSDSSGRDTKNIVPGSAMWSELSSSEKKQIADKYSRGEGPSISVRYNKDTGKFDEPGYGDQGQYGDIVKALNAVNESTSVNKYCQFISEMAKKNTPKATPKATKPSKPKTDKQVVAPVKPVATTEPDLFSSVSGTPAAAPAPTAPSVPAPVASVAPVTAPAPVTPAPTPTATAGPETLQSPTQFGGRNFPKVPEGYKGAIKYKTSPVSTGAFEGGSKEGYSALTPDAPKGEMNLIRYLTAPKLSPGTGYIPPTAQYHGEVPEVGNLSYLGATRNKIEMFKKGDIVYGREQKTTTPPPVRTGPTSREAPQNTINPAIKNVLQNRTARVAGGIGLAGAVLAGAALYGSQSSQPTNAAQQISPQAIGTVNTEDTPLASKPKFKARRVSLEDDTTPKRLFNP